MIGQSDLNNYIVRREREATPFSNISECLLRGMDQRCRGMTVNVSIGMVEAKIWDFFPTGLFQAARCFVFKCKMFFNIFLFKKDNIF